MRSNSLYIRKIKKKKKEMKEKEIGEGEKTICNGTTTSAKR